MGQIPSVNADQNVDHNLDGFQFTEEVRERLRKEMESTKEPKVVKNEMEKSTFSEPELVDNPALADQESEMTRNKNYWKKRLEDLQRNQEKIKEVLEAERLQGFQDVQGSLSEVQGEEGKSPCEDGFKTVASCYKEHVKEPLVCDEEVASFVACVKTKRAESLAPKKQE